MERGGDVGGFVARGNDNDKRGIAGWGLIPLLAKKIGDAWEATGSTDPLPEPRESDEPGEHGNAELYGMVQAPRCDLDGYKSCIISIAVYLIKLTSTYVIPKTA